MLFSNPSIVLTMNSLFENTWQSMRPVPTMSLDFGNGRTVKRTMHGNIATVICTPDEKVVDIIGGLLSPAAYSARLIEAAAIAQKLEAMSASEQLAALKRFHQRSNTSLASEITPEELKSREEVDNWKQLAEDTRQNNGIRRGQIDALLIEAGLTTPKNILPRLFKEVLHCDLNDPLLGLGALLYLDEK